LSEECNHCLSSCFELCRKQTVYGWSPVSFSSRETDVHCQLTSHPNVITLLPFSVY
jgi:hypothetical protein